MVHGEALKSKNLKCGELREVNRKLRATMKYYQVSQNNMEHHKETWTTMEYHVASGSSMENTTKYYVEYLML